MELIILLSVCEELQKALMKGVHAILVELLVGRALSLKGVYQFLGLHRPSALLLFEELEVWRGVFHCDDGTVKFVDIIHVEGRGLESQDDFHSLGKDLRQPELNVALNRLVFLEEEIGLVDEDDQIPVQLRVSLNLSTHQIQPVTHQNAEALLVGVDALSQVEDLSQIPQDFQKHRGLGSFLGKDVHEVGEDDVLVVFVAVFEVELNPAAHELLGPGPALKSHDDWFLVQLVLQDLFELEIIGLEEPVVFVPVQNQVSGRPEVEEGLNHCQVLFPFLFMRLDHSSLGNHFNLNLNLKARSNYFTFYSSVAAALPPFP